MKKLSTSVRNILIGLLVVLILLLLFIRQEPFAYIWLMDDGQYLNNDTLIKLCPDGTRLVEIQFGQSGAIGVDPNNGYLWAPELNDLGDVNKDQLVKYDMAGNLLARYQDYRTTKIAVDPNDGGIWVGLGNENRLVKLNPQGEIVLEAVGVQTPRSIAVNPTDGSLWVADNDPNRHLIHFNAQGEQIFSTPTDGFFSNTPHQVAVDPVTGNVWYAGSFVKKVILRSASGKLLAETGGFDRPVAIAVDPVDSSAWVADFSLDSPGGVVKLDANGNLLFRKVLDTPPRSIGFNTVDETVWVGLEGALVVLSRDGEIRHIYPGYAKPFSYAFLSVKNTLPAKVEFIKSCLLGTGEDQPRKVMKDTPEVIPNPPVQITPSPLLDSLPSTIQPTSSVLQATPGAGGTP